MYPIHSSNPQAAAERQRQERLAEMDLENNPGLRALREAREAEQEGKRRSEADIEEATRAFLTQSLRREILGNHLGQTWRLLFEG